MTQVITVIAWLLIPAGVLPVVTAWVLRKYRHSDSAALRERWHLALVLAALGAVTATIAIFAVLGIRSGLIWVVFGLVLLAVDVVSGKWLLDFRRGRFR